MVYCVDAEVYALARVLGNAHYHVNYHVRDTRTRMTSAKEVRHSTIMKSELDEGGSLADSDSVMTMIK
jgi:hypothetical protein